MSDEEYDVVVVGAGLAGLACAGELVVQGLRPLLVSETAEVGHNFRSRWVGQNRGLVQHPMWQVGWGGGYWYPLARQLNVPLRFFPGLPFQATILGTGKVNDLPFCGSPRALAEMILSLAPFPLEVLGREAERILAEGMAIPYQDLLAMDRVRMSEWLEHHKADPMVSMLLLMLCGNMAELDVPSAHEHLSVLGKIGALRLVVAAEGTIPVVYPDVQEGLCIPLAQAIEERGGTVWRGRRAAAVLLEGDAVATKVRGRRRGRPPLPGLAMRSF